MVISLRNNFPAAEREKHRDKRFHFTARRKIHHGNGEGSDPFQLNSYLIARFDNVLHRVGLRPQKLPPLFISGTQVRGAAEAPLRRDAIWKFLENDIGAEEIGDVIEGT
jgi:hypothetical protein